jgi:hypothetical protein
MDRDSDLSAFGDRLDIKHDTVLSIESQRLGYCCYYARRTVIRIDRAKFCIES